MLFSGRCIEDAAAQFDTAASVLHRGGQANPSSMPLRYFCPGQLERPHATFMLFILRPVQTRVEFAIEILADADAVHQWYWANVPPTRRGFNANASPSAASADLFDSVEWSSIPRMFSSNALGFCSSNRPPVLGQALMMALGWRWNRLS